MTDQRHRLVKDLMERNDGWAGGAVNETALEYDYMTRHFTMSVIFLSWTVPAVAIGSVGNIFVSTTFIVFTIFSFCVGMVVC